jgi:two-component system, cell cycle response regulator
MPDKPSDKRRNRLPSLTFESEEDRESTKVIASSTAPVAQKRDRPFVIVIGGGNAGEMHAIGEDAVIGRGAAVSIRVDGDGVSRRHARLTRQRGDVYVEDLDSANGTFVNGERVDSKVRLEDGDRITLGSTAVLKFTYNDELDEAFQRRMFEGALRDALTQAHNRRYFLEQMEKELAYAQRHETPLSLLMLDIDHFKRINDEWGHPTGDAVLIHLVKVALDVVRREDTFARYGGEEFVVLCRGVDAQGGARLAERLRERVEQLRVLQEGRRIGLTVSIGVAACPDVDATQPGSLIAAADDALYAAKRGGRNRIVVWTRTT